MPDTRTRTTERERQFRSLQLQWITATLTGDKVSARWAAAQLFILESQEPTR